MNTSEYLETLKELKNLNPNYTMDDWISYLQDAETNNENKHLEKLQELIGVSSPELLCGECFLYIPPYTTNIINLYRISTIINPRILEVEDILLVEGCAHCINKLPPFEHSKEEVSIKWFNDEISAGTMRRLPESRFNKLLDVIKDLYNKVDHEYQEFEKLVR